MEEIKPVHEVILDAGPIIHLDELSCLHLLMDFKKLFVPETVWREVEYHKPSALGNHDIPLEKLSFLEEKEPRLLILYNAFSLDEGEKQAISLCLKYQNSIFITDDAAARLAAKSLGIRAYGTIGILLRAIRRKQLKPEEVIKYLEEIPLKSTLFIKNNVIAQP